MVAAGIVRPPRRDARGHKPADDEPAADFAPIRVGACAIAAGLWSVGKGYSWLLSLHGLALSVFGAIAVSPLVKGPLSFRPISLLFVLMAVSVAAFALRTAQTLRSDPPGKWFLSRSGAASIGFAFSFLAVGFGWLRLEPSHFWIWMSSYFAFCATFMLWLALRVRGHRTSAIEIPNHYASGTACE